MKNFIRALQIFLKYKPEDCTWPFHCEHDTLYFGIDISPEEMDKGDIDELNDIGIFWSENDRCFMSFKYGSC